PKLATIRDLLGHRAHGLAHGLQPVEALFAAATVHYCGHGNHLSGASTVVALRQQAGVLYRRCGLGCHDGDVLDHGALLSTEPRMGIGHAAGGSRSEEHTSELQSRSDIVCRLLLEKKKKTEKPSLVDKTRTQSTSGQVST